jgi:hypothetical protein
LNTELLLAPNEEEFFGSSSLVKQPCGEAAAIGSLLKVAPSLRLFKKGPTPVKRNELSGGKIYPQ